jgi:hypothetical protein
MNDLGLNPEGLRKRRETVLTILALGLVLFAAVFTALKFLHTSQPDDAELAEIARAAVRRGFAPSLSIQFPGSEDFALTPMGEYRYQVIGRVQAIDPRGRSQLYTFECAIAPDDRGRWHSVSLSIRVGY